MVHVSIDSIDSIVVVVIDAIIGPATKDELDSLPCKSVVAGSMVTQLYQCLI